MVRTLHFGLPIADLTKPVDGAQQAHRQTDIITTPLSVIPRSRPPRHFISIIYSTTATDV
jgi:hypothetical protein